MERRLFTKEFRVGDLFTIKPTRSYKCSNDELFSDNGTTHVVTNSNQNNGRTGKSNLPPTEKNIITFSDTTSGSDTMFYQDGAFIGYSHIQGMHPKYNIPKNALFYIITCCRKATQGIFDYANKMRRDIVENLLISLPIKPKIDFAVIRELILAGGGINVR